MVNSKPSKSTISTCLSCGAFFRISVRSRTSILTSDLERTLNRIAVGVHLILRGVLLLAASALGGDLGTEHLIHDIRVTNPAVTVRRINIQTCIEPSWSMPLIVARSRPALYAA